MRFHCFFRADIRPKKACAGRVDPAEQQSTKPDVDTLASALESYIPPSQACAQEIAFSFPMDLATTIDLAAAHCTIIQCRRRGVISADCRDVELARSAHSECLVGPLIVKLLWPQIQCGLAVCPGHSF